MHHYSNHQDMRDFVEAECLVPVTEGTHIELQPLKDNEGKRTAGGIDMASMDSTDTFASCNTHPFNSQADLTRDDSSESQTEQKDSSKDPTLYVNPLEDTAENPPKPSTPRSSPRHKPKPLAYTTDVFDDTKSTDILLGGSRTSLQDSPLPKHRRARFQEGTPRPFTRLMESVERARSEREKKEAAEKNKQSANARGRSDSKSSLGDVGEKFRHSSPERKKSILKHRDPETEHLLLDLGDEKPKKPRALPVKFVGLDDKDESCSRPRRVLPRSPMPLSSRGRAPLADFLAEFGGQEKAVRDELTPENLLKDSLEPPALDRRNANTVIYRCSRPMCTSNQPIMPDTGTTQRPPPMCVCGSSMTPASTTPTRTLLPTPPAIISCGTGDFTPSVRQDTTENRIQTDELNNGPTPGRELEDLLFADQSSPSEETRLLGGSPPVQKGARLSS